MGPLEKVVFGHVSCVHRHGPQEMWKQRCPSKEVVCCVYYLIYYNLNQTKKGCTWQILKQVAVVLLKVKVLKKQTPLSMDVSYISAETQM